MVGALLEPSGGLARLKAIYATSIDELGSALSPDLRDELNRLALPFEDGDLPSDVELEIFDGLKAIPPYDADDDVPGQLDPAVEAFKRAIAETEVAFLLLCAVSTRM